MPVFRVVLYIFFVTGMLGCSTRSSEQQFATFDGSMSRKLYVINNGANDNALSSMVDSNSTAKIGLSVADNVVEFSKIGANFAFIESVGSKTRVVFNGKPGKLYETIESSSLSISPDGSRVAYYALKLGRWYLIENDNEHGIYDSPGRIAFSNNSRHIAYEAQVVGITNIVIDFVIRSHAESYNDRAYFLKGDQKLTYIEVKDNSKHVLVVSDLLHKNILRQDIIKPEMFYITNSASVVAAVQKVKEQERVVTYNLRDNGEFKFEKLYDEVFKPVVSDNGSNLAFIGRKGGDYFLVLNGIEEKIASGEYPSIPEIRPDGAAASVLVVNGQGSAIQNVGKNNTFISSYFKECGQITYSADSKHQAFLAKSKIMFNVIVDGKPGPDFDVATFPKYSSDNRYIMYLARNKGKRFVVIAKADGTIIKQCNPFDRVFKADFSSDNSSIMYGAIDGRQLLWQVEKI